MDKIEPVSAASPMHGRTAARQEQHSPAGRQGQVEVFQASLLGQYAQQLDPDDQHGADAEQHELSQALQHLLQLLDERVRAMREHALQSAGHASHGLMGELWQVDEVFKRLVPLWRHPQLQSLHEVARPRLVLIFAACQFVLQAVRRAGEPHEWQDLHAALQAHQRQLS